jgi:hypothetical protein
MTHNLPAQVFWLLLLLHLLLSSCVVSACENPANNPLSLSTDLLSGDPPLLSTSDVEQLTPRYTDVNPSYEVRKLLSMIDKYEPVMTHAEKMQLHEVHELVQNNASFSLIVRHLDGLFKGPTFCATFEK